MHIIEMPSNVVKAKIDARKFIWQILVNHVSFEECFGWALEFPNILREFKQCLAVVRVCVCADDEILRQSNVFMHVNRLLFN